MGSFFSRVPKDPTDTSALQAIKKKAIQALQYAKIASGPTEPPEGKGIRIQGDNQEIVDIWWSDDLAQLVLAFKVPPDVLTGEADETVQPKCLARLRTLQLKEGTVCVAPQLSKVLDQFLAQKGFERVQAILGGKIPRRVICTGADVGGSVAAVAAVLLAVQYPSAEVRCVTLNAPVITYGNAALATLYRYMVGFSYHLSRQELLYLYPPEEGGFLLYGHWCEGANLKPTRFDPTTATPQNWKEDDLQKLISTVAPVDAALPRAAPLPQEKAERASRHERHQLKVACYEANIESPKVQTWMADLYQKDPAREVSLRWMDDPTTAPFEKLESLEKMLLAGKKVAAMAGLAAASYSDRADFVHKTGLKDAIFINRNGAGQKDGQAYVAYRPDINTLLVAFRGTKGMIDALADLRTSHSRANFLETIVKGAHVHKGFYVQLVDMFPTLSDAIESLTTRPGEDHSPVQHVYVTGHSLGGALATIGAAMLVKKFPSADVCAITFAAPRAGNAEFDAAFATLVSTSLRFVYNYDAVPTVPMWYLGFKHVDHGLWLKPATSPKSKDGIDKDAELDMYGTPPHSPAQCLAKVGDDIVGNHSMGGRYIGSLVGHMYRLVEEEKEGQPPEEAAPPDGPSQQVEALSGYSYSRRVCLQRPTLGGARPSPFGSCSRTLPFRRLPVGRRPQSLRQMALHFPEAQFSMKTCFP
eukprot:jgi/Botrbrau1/9039/Bobra.0376s0016.1